MLFGLRPPEIACTVLNGFLELLMRRLFMAFFMSRRVAHCMTNFKVGAQGGLISAAYVVGPVIGWTKLALPE